ncbi:MAG TPA: hypothetical protein VM450_18540 [Thermomicrobiales bacterium]|nr:hypothetical protein [Thermomicrobiales bacterium]
MGLKRNTRLTIIATALIAVLGMGLLSMGTGIAAGMDNGFVLFAQKGNGNGNGQGNGNGNGQGQNNGNNGNGQGQNNSNAPEQPGTGNNGQGQGQENGNPPETNPGQGQDAAAPEEGDAVETDTQAQDEADTDEAAAEESTNAKVNVCHVTGNGDSHMITVSVNAAPAHESHGDTVDVASEAECDVAAEQPAPGTPGAEPTEPAASPVPVEPTVPAATPVPVEPTVPAATPVPGDEDDEDDAGATPDASPEVPDGTPIATPVL